MSCISTLGKFLSYLTFHFKNRHTSWEMCIWIHLHGLCLSQDPLSTDTRQSHLCKLIKNIISVNCKHIKRSAQHLMLSSIHIYSFIFTEKNKTKNTLICPIHPIQKCFCQHLNQRFQVPFWANAKVTGRKTKHNCSATTTALWWQ